MNCTEFDTGLLDYVYKELGVSLETQFEDHLQGCLVCQKKLIQIQNTKHVLGQLPLENVPKHLLSLRKHVKKSHRFAMPMWRYGAIAASFLIIFGGLVSVNNFLAPDSRLDRGSFTDGEHPGAKDRSSSVNPQASPETRWIENAGARNTSFQEVSLGTPFESYSEVPTLQPIKPKWYSTQPFEMQKGQFAVLPFKIGRAHV